MSQSKPKSKAPKSKTPKPTTKPKPVGKPISGGGAGHRPDANRG